MNSFKVIRPQVQYIDTLGYRPIFSLKKMEVIKERFATDDIPAWFYPVTIPAAWTMVFITIKLLCQHLDKIM